MHFGPSRTSRYCRFGLFLLVLLCNSACHTADPLYLKFEQTVELEMIISAGDQPAEPGSRPIEVFAREHGAAAVPVFQKAVSENRHGSSKRAWWFAWAGLYGMESARAGDVGELLSEVAGDPRVDNKLRLAALRALAAQPRQEAARVYGEELLRETDPDMQKKIVRGAIESGDPNVRPYLEKARDTESDSDLRRTLESAIQLLEHPRMCRLFDKLKYSMLPGWKCQYNCPGPQPVILMDMPEECPQLVPPPR